MQTICLRFFVKLRALLRIDNHNQQRCQFYNSAVINLGSLEMDWGPQQSYLAKRNETAVITCGQTKTKSMTARWTIHCLSSINNCPKRCSTKQSTYYSASSLYPKHVEWTCRIINRLLINRLLCVASRWTFINRAYSVYSQLRSIAEAVPPSATWGGAMQWWLPNLLTKITQWYYCAFLYFLRSQTSSVGIVTRQQTGQSTNVRWIPRRVRRFLSEASIWLRLVCEVGAHLRVVSRWITC